MQNVLENVGDAAAATQKPGLVSTIFREYRNNFGLFWRVMLPIIIVSLVFNIALFLFFKLSFPESQWIFGTSDGVAASHGALHTSPPQSADVGWGMKNRWFICSYRLSMVSDVSARLCHSAMP